MDNIRAIAQAIMQGRGHAPVQPSISVKATPPALPPFQPPGMGLGLPQMAEYMKRAQTPTPAAPQTITSSPAQPQVMPDPSAPPLSPMPAAQPIGMAPGMMPMPQTTADLEAWRRMMDQLQMARQGA